MVDIHSTKQNTSQRGFTIVELLIVIVVIAILAAISFLAFTGVQVRATESLLQSDLTNASKKLGVKQVDSGTYAHPSLPGDITPSQGAAFEYTSDGTDYCLTATASRSGVSAYHVTKSGAVTKGTCPGHSAGGGSEVSVIAMQTITSSSCPTTRTVAADARDNHTYWVQKMADGKCWMLTNLAYAGGGTDTHGDVRTLQNGSNDSARTYTAPKYYIPPNANPTTSPTEPSASTNGGATNPQYGYMYNWCAAMGAQTSSGACNTNYSGTAPDQSKSACPAGWRLPTGGASGEQKALYDAQSGTAQGISGWLPQYAGNWDGNFSYQGNAGSYWSGTKNSHFDSFYFSITPSYSNATYGIDKYVPASVRCVAN